MAVPLALAPGPRDGLLVEGGAPLLVLGMGDLTLAVEGMGDVLVAVVGVGHLLVAVVRVGDVLVAVGRVGDVLVAVERVREFLVVGVGGGIVSDGIIVGGLWVVTEEGGDEDTAAGAADGVWSPATEGGSLSIRKGMPSI